MNSKTFCLFTTQAENPVPINNWLKENSSIFITDMDITIDQTYVYLTFVYIEEDSFLIPENRKLGRYECEIFQFPIQTPESEYHVGKWLKSKRLRPPIDIHIAKDMDVNRYYIFMAVICAIL